MNTLEVTKWFGFTLLCLVILSAPLALVAVKVAQKFQERSSRLNHIQEDCEQIDLLLPVRKAPQTATKTSKDHDVAYPKRNGVPLDRSGPALSWPIRPICR